MPTPEQSRYTPGTKDAMGDPKFVAIERALNRLPVFPEFEYQLKAPDTTTTLSNTNAIDMDLVTDGLVSVRFEKYETWTDVKVQVAMSGFATAAARSVVISGVLTDQSGVETTVDPIARFYFNTSLEHHSFYGESRVEDLIPGVYALQLQWRVSANSFRVDPEDTIHVTVAECLPTPTV